MIKQIKNFIENYEYNRNGLRRINGAYVKVVNLRMKQDKVTADIILGNDCEQHYERFNDCEYPKTMFGVK